MISRTGKFPEFLKPARIKRTEEFMNTKNPEQDVKIFFLGEGAKSCEEHLACQLSNQNLPNFLARQTSVEEIVDRIIQKFGKERIAEKNKTNKRNIIRFSSTGGSFQEKFILAMSYFDENNLNVESYSYDSCCSDIPTPFFWSLKFKPQNFVYNYFGIHHSFEELSGMRFRIFTAVPKKRNQKSIFYKTDYQAIDCPYKLFQVTI